MIKSQVDAADELMNLAEETKAIRESLGARKKVRWPQSIRDSALRISDAGIGFSQIAFATGIKYGSLIQWRNRRGESSPAMDSGIGFSELKVVPSHRRRGSRVESKRREPAARPSVVLIGPRGYRIENLEWRALRELMQAGLI
jgi:hypothetical protein